MASLTGPSHPALPVLLACLPGLLAACGGDDGRGDELGVDGIYSATLGTADDPSSTSESSDSADTSSGTSSDDGGLKLDIGMLPDIPGQQGPIIPETCVQAEAGLSTVGCLFYGVDLDSHDAVENQQFAIAVSNVQENQVATVQVEQKQGNSWGVISGPTMVQALDLAIFNLPAFSQDDSGIKAGGAYRVSSDVPIIAYQFNPIDGASSYLSDASMLYPVPTWDH
ncbi:MAG: hypothetical protein KC431_24370, partial [Myxococcales bacterium]|nr:hypothetical protein [Myxococcales bacterium]